MPASHHVCEYYDAPKLTVVLVPAQAARHYDPKIDDGFAEHWGTWTGMSLFSLGFYYGLARLVMWAASL